MLDEEAETEQHGEYGVCLAAEHEEQTVPDSLVAEVQEIALRRGGGKEKEFGRKLRQSGYFHKVNMNTSTNQIRWNMYLQVERFYFGFDTILYILWSYGIDWPEGGKMRVGEESIATR